jgi:hypothetical protein
MNGLDQGVAHTEISPPAPAADGTLVHEDLKIGRSSVGRRVQVEAAHLPAPVVIAPREELVCRWRGGEPGPYGPVKPRLLLIWGVHRHERPETVRTHIASHDQEMAWRDIRQEPVLIAEGNNSHADRRRQCRIVAQTSATTRNR